MCAAFMVSGGVFSASTADAAPDETRVAQTAEGDTNWEQQRQQAEQATQADASDGPAWRRLGDALVKLDRPGEALAAYQRAETLGAGDEQMTIAMGDAHKALGEKRAAYRCFAKLQSSTDTDIRETACQQMQYLVGYRSKFLPNPLFTELYVQAGAQTIGDALFIDGQLRSGIDLMSDERVQVYATVRLTTDNRSGVIGRFPREYFDNVLVVGAGVRVKPYLPVPLYLLAEVGWSRDLIDLGRDRHRSDVRAGLEYYQEFFTDRSCMEGVHVPMRFVLTLSGESKYYSRYDDAIISAADVRPGIRLLETKFSSLDLLAVGAVFTNSEADDFVQFTQVGGALVWMPNARYDLKLVAEAGQTYFPGGDSEFNASLYAIYSVLF